MTDKKFKEEQEEFIQDVVASGGDLGGVCENYEKYFPSMPNGEYKKNFLKRVYKNWEEHGDKEVKPIVFYKNEVKFLRGIADEKTRRMIYSLMCKEKDHPHVSGWINLDFKETMKYGFAEAKARNIKLEELYACVKLGVEVMVVGSTKPIVCFKLPVKGAGEVAFMVNNNETLKGLEGEIL